MKLTQQQLKQLITEEVQRALNEAPPAAAARPAVAPSAAVAQFQKSYNLWATSNHQGRIKPTGQWDKASLAAVQVLKKIHPKAIIHQIPDATLPGELPMITKYVRALNLTGCKPGQTS